MDGRTLARTHARTHARTQIYVAPKL